MNSIWGSTKPGSPEYKIQSTIDTLAQVKGSALNLGDISLGGGVMAWKIDSEDLEWTPVPTQVVFFKSDFLEDNCQNSGSEDCKKGFRRAVEALRFTELTYRCVSVIGLEMIDDALKFSARRRVQWENYWNSVPQWPWEELLINGPIYRSLTKNELGSPEPPTFQLIVLHPEIVMEYVSAATDGEQFKAALLVELAGINWWNWEKDGSQSGPFFGYPLGFGLVTTFADREGSQDWGWGGVVHINHYYNIGVTIRDGDPGVFVSVNLSRLYSSFSEKTRELGAQF